MQALLLCPSPRPNVTLLTENFPLALAPLLGKNLLEYWIEYLESRGVRDIVIRSADRPAQIQTAIGDGARWGLQITVETESTESPLAQITETLERCGKPKPDFIVKMDHLPERSEYPLFGSYAAWFKGLHNWIPLAQAIERIGQWELQPGVWVGLRPRINSTVRLIAPCWIGDHVSINAEAVIGPGVIIEPASIIGTGAHIAHSIVGPATFVGAHTRIDNSIACHNTLINWSTNACLRVPDACWLSSLKGPLSTHRPETWHGSMSIKTDGHNLHISQLVELSAKNATQFMNAIREALSTAAAVIEIDLACTRFVDSCGLATLCNLQRITNALGIRLHLLHPQPPLQQLLELTQLHELFGLARSGVSPPTVTQPEAPLIPSPTGSTARWPA
jgi:anti-anti-sigma factor